MPPTTTSTPELPDTKPPGYHRILLVGLGAVAQTHLDVLAGIDNVTVAGGVDTAPRPDIQFRGRPLPTYSSLARSADDLAPTLVVVATPTSTHAAVCDQVTDIFPTAEILVEKPAADNLDDARRLLGNHDRRCPIGVAYHLRYAPEVMWGIDITRAASTSLGAPISARSIFTDPYASQIDTAMPRFGSSWLDSGINALSVLDQFIQLKERESFRELGSTRHSVFEGRFSCGSGVESLVVTSWHVTEAAKTTSITYSCGAELVLDHTAVAGYLRKDGGIVALFGTDGTINRRYSHYLALYHSWLVEGHALPTAADNLRLHKLLM